MGAIRRYVAESGVTLSGEDDDAVWGFIRDQCSS